MVLLLLLLLHHHLRHAAALLPLLLLILLATSVPSPAFALPPPAPPLPPPTTDLAASASAAAPPAPKYFHEPGGSLARVHYDDRFFPSSGELPPTERAAALRDLIRAYLATTRAAGLETWLAHGTLLGWWWGARVMPWDYDLDVQLTDATMARLLDARLNGTRHDVAVDGTTTTRTYYLDVNPHWQEPSSPGGGFNIIDARWIDVASGLFVDITVVREREPERRPGVWSCKNNHRYDARDVWPLRETEFEGVPASIPHSFEDILGDEYSRSSMIKESHQHHLWDHDLKQWVMDDPEQRRLAKDTAAAYKKQQLGSQGRL